jgi:hypothetical protein
MVNRINGVRGDLKVGTQSAVSFSSWTVERGDSPQTWSFSARTQSVNAFLLTQCPDVLVLDAGQIGRLHWQGVALEVGADYVRGTLSGSPEVRK